MGDVIFDFNYSKITLEIDVAFNKIFENCSPNELREVVENNDVIEFSQNMKKLLCKYIDEKCKMTKEIIKGWTCFLKFL